MCTNRGLLGWKFIKNKIKYENIEEFLGFVIVKNSNHNIETILKIKIETFFFTLRFIFYFQWETHMSPTGSLLSK